MADQVVLPDGLHSDVPADGSEPRVELGRSPEDLDDVVLAAVAESPPRDGCAVHDPEVVEAERTIVLVDERDSCSGPEAPPHGVPERVEVRVRNVRQPGGEEHEVVRAV